MSSALLSTTTERWAEVRKENEADKHLITPEQLKVWEEFEAKTTARLKKIIREFTGEVLSDSDRQWLMDLGNTIDRAKRVTRDELEAEKAEREEKERARRALEEEKRQEELRKKREVEETRKGLMGLLD